MTKRVMKERKEEERQFKRFCPSNSNTESRDLMSPQSEDGMIHSSDMNQSGSVNRATMLLMNSMKEYERQQQMAKRDTITLYRIEDIADSENGPLEIDCRCCLKKFPEDAMKECLFCDKSTCDDCLEECLSCHQIFCSFCSIKNYSRSAPFSLCITCYAHHNSPL